MTYNEVSISQLVRGMLRGTFLEERISKDKVYIDKGQITSFVQWFNREFF
jgi:hypothetical protein